MFWELGRVEICQIEKKMNRFRVNSPLSEHNQNKARGLGHVDCSSLCLCDLNGMGLAHSHTPSGRQKEVKGEHDLIGESFQMLRTRNRIPSSRGWLDCIWWRRRVERSARVNTNNCKACKDVWTPTWPSWTPHFYDCCMHSRHSQLGRPVVVAATANRRAE